MPNVFVYEGDCLEVMRGMSDESIDAVVCDPPYGLGKPPPVADVLQAWLSGEPYHAKGGGFMGAKWDAFVPGPEVWRECLRVLKPGGHLLAFFGTRTYHLGATAVELAGFEVRDLIAWLYGQGFPKSRNVGKDIDKSRDDTAEVRVVCRWLRARITEHPTHTTDTIANAFGFHTRMVDHWAARDSDSQPTLPTLEQWDRLRELLDFGSDMDAPVLRLNLRKGLPGEAWAKRPVTGTVQEWTNRSNYALTSADGLRRDIPATPEAAQWEGWGTALKPALEPVVFARKPFKGATYRQVLATGTGAINVDGCRLPMSESDFAALESKASKNPTNNYATSPTRKYGIYTEDRASRPHTAGRWPANVAIDEEAASMLDAQSGRLAGRGNKSPSKRVCRPNHVYAMDIQDGDCGGRLTYDKGGGASRFFYCAKANNRERSAGVGDLKTRHKTVKPIGLMRWLVRLVTPPGGTVLDPFAGSGTTGLAAQAEGFGAVLIEREPEYFALAQTKNSHLALLRGIAALGDS